MKIDKLKDQLTTVFKSEKHIPIMLWSPPGLGKSSAVKQVADELGFDFLDLRLSLLNPVDLRGLPTIDREKKVAEWLIPSYLPKKGKGIFFLDEINLAPAAVMNAGYQLILDRALGDYRLPDAWKIIAAGNRMEDGANVTKMPSPLLNRFIHLELECDDKVWRKWAMQNGIHEQIIAFIAKFPQHLFKMPKAGEPSFPTPRSWEKASDLYTLDPKNLRIDQAVGAVASEFYAWLTVYDRMPDVQKILEGKIHDIPKAEDLDVMWALVTAMSVRCEPKHLDNLFPYIAKMPKEFEVLTIIQISDKSDTMRAAITNHSEWSKWIKRNQALLKEEDDNDYVAVA